ncbi:MAG: signal peptidase II [Armatimonadetes bacterium]|nr:signal peptidase II [Armatimonadota bacterium]
MCVRDNGEDAVAPRRSSAGRVAATVVLVLACLLVVAADQTSKAWALAHSHARHTLVPGLVSTTFAVNTGATFGFFAGKALVLAAVSMVILVAVLLLWWFEARVSLVASLGVGFLAGGALGNLYDRVARGFVVDFLRFDFAPWWPAFNAADAATVLGVILVAGWLWLAHTPASAVRD